MKEQLIEFETAKLAFEKGFDLKTEEYFTEDGYLYSYRHVSFYKNLYSRPSQSILQKWLREKDILVYCVWYDDKMTPSRWSIYAHSKNKYHQYISGNENYETALEIGLREGLKLL